MTTIICFGDSITEGYNDAYGGWVQRFADKVHAANPNEHVSIVNLGVAGNRTPDVLARITKQTNEHTKPEEPFVILIAVGVNDAAWILEREMNWTPVHEFTLLLGELFREARRLTPHVFAIGITPVVEEKLNPAPWEESIAYRLSDITHYDKIIREVAATTDIPSIDILKAFVTRDDWRSLFPDGLHPGAQGHQVIADTIYKEGEKMMTRKRLDAN